MIRSVTIAIPTYNRSDLLAQTLTSLESISLPVESAVELIVVANACTDDTTEVCRRSLPRLPFPARCVEEPKPGLNEARNRAVLECESDVLALLDDDVLVDEDWLIELIRVYDETPADIVGGRIDLWWQAVERPDWLLKNHEGLLSGLDLGEQVIEINKPSLVGANVSFRHDLFDRIGNFRSGLDRIGKELLAGGETELLRRALQSGARIYYAPAASLKHWVPPERVQRDYLVGVAKGNARSRILMKEPFGFKQFLRSVVGNSYLAGISEASRWLANLRSDRGAAMTFLLRRSAGQSGLVAALRRGLGLSRGRR